MKDVTKTRLRPYQKTGILQISRFGGRCLVADEQGLGKSAESLVWTQWADMYPLVIVCPATLKPNWEREAKLWLGKRVSILNGRKPDLKRNRRTLLRGPNEITIINYDILENWLDWLIALQPKTIIGDEVQFLKSTRAKRTQSMRKLVLHTPHFLALSGTPFTNRPPELWSILNMLWPMEFPNYFPFANRYGKWRKGFYGMQYKGPQNLEELHKRLVGLGMLRRLKKDVLKDLPEKTRTIVPLEIENRKEYDLAKSDLVSWIRKNISSAKAYRAQRAMAMVRVGYLLRLVAQLKLQRVVEWLDLFLENTDEKILVGGVHRKILTPLHERYPNSLLLTGKTTQPNRWKAVDEFQLKPNNRLFFLNLQAGGVGLNLTAASTTATIELPWTPGECVQFEDRTHRIGQLKKVNCFYLVAKDTVESRMCELLQEKQSEISQTMDGSVETNGFSVFDQLIKELR